MYTDRTSSNRLYRIWTEARRRCRNPRQDSYKEKSITFDSVWDDYIIFMNWSLCNGYDDSLSLERIDNDLGYNHTNCKWATRSEQQYNQKKKSSHKSSSQYKGVSRYPKEGRSKMWRARVYVKGKEIRLGDFTTEIQAAKARDAFMISNKINTPLNFS